jgi:hypothetical protein
LILHRRTTMAFGRKAKKAARSFGQFKALRRMSRSAALASAGYALLRYVKNKRRPAATAATPEARPPG